MLPACSHVWRRTAGKSQNTQPAPLPAASTGQYQTFLKVNQGSSGLGEMSSLGTGAKLCVLCANHQGLLDVRHLRTRARKQTLLPVALEETAGRGTTGDPAEPPSAQAEPCFNSLCSNLLLFGECAVGAGVWASCAEAGSLESRGSNVIFPGQAERSL